MPGATQDRPTLANLFTEGIVQRHIRKPLLGKPYLETSSHLIIGAHVYERSAILGRARSRFLALLLEMCSLPKQTPQDTRDLEKFAREQAQLRLSRFDGSPTSFVDFYFTTEAARAAGESLSSGMGFLFLQAHAKRKVPFETSAGMLWGASTEGAAFGTMYPKPVETMMRSYSEVNGEEWRDAHEHGLDIPAEPPTVSVEQLEQEVLSVVAPFAAHFYPHLVKPLDLAHLTPPPASRQGPRSGR